MRVRVAAVLLLAVACGKDEEQAAPSDAGPDATPLPACVDGKPTRAWPEGPYEIGLAGILPPGLVFEDVSLDPFYEPCAERSRLLIVRSSAAFCGTCIWHVENTKRMIPPAFADRVVLVDLLVADEDNMPPTPEAKERWRARMDVPGPLALDPLYKMRSAQIGSDPLPAYAIVDTKTMRIIAAESDPSPVEMANRIALELALLDGAPRPEAQEIPRVDGLTENHREMLLAMKLPGAPPPDPTNEFADSPAAAALGKLLFSDPLLSPSGTVSCATCHDPVRDFTDGAPQSTGVAKLNRNSPSVALAAHARWQFWDGRADTLWMQALGPFEDDKEIASSRLFVAHQIATRYATEYAAAFGAKYPLPDLSALPPSGKPGQPAYDQLDAEDKERVTRVFVNVGKAIAAFERTLSVEPNAIDRYIDGDANALTQEQKESLAQFFEVGCAQCHWGPRLTDDAFHVIRFGTGRQDGLADNGRFDVLPKLAAAEFVATSPWSDAPSAAKQLVLPQADTMIGAFKTPTLRGLPTSAPYGHGGTVPTIAGVTEHYGMRGVPHGDGSAAGNTEPWVPSFDANAQRRLAPILEAMTGRAVVP